jgi:L-aminopeptidase/D-esterase-like protein
VYLAVVEAIEEAVVNALVAAEAVATFKPAECMCPALDTGRQREIFAEPRPETVA